MPDTQGAAVFRGDKLIGFIDGSDAMSMLFIQDKIKGGILVAKEDNSDRATEVSLEISNNKTKVKPVIRNGAVEIDINTETITAIDELATTENLITDDELKKLEASTEKMLKARIEGIIEKAQTEYDADMFGFGDKLRKGNPSAWEKIEQDWSNIFKDIKVNVDTKVHIKNSAMLSKPLEVGY
jgi:spore germination protein KC